MKEKSFEFRDATMDVLKTAFSSENTNYTATIKDITELSVNATATDSNAAKVRRPGTERCHGKGSSWRLFQGEGNPVLPHERSRSEEADGAAEKRRQVHFDDL